MKCGLIAGLIGVDSLAHAEPPSPQQRIALTAKPSVVRVWGAYIGTFEVMGTKVTTGIGGTGTGWFITPDGYIATNAHVVADIHNGPQVAEVALREQVFKDIEKHYGAELRAMNETQIATLVRSVRLVKTETRQYVLLPNGEKLDYEIKEFGKPGTGSDSAIIKVNIENAPNLTIGDSSKSVIEDHIVVIGYPGVADFGDLLDEKSQLQATVTDGSISSLKKATTGEQILQISAPITHGNSGGPVIDQRGNVVGLATFGNEGGVQGFNFVVASNTLMEQIKRANVKIKPSETNKAWSSGLTHYWADEYSLAIKDFEEVQLLFPNHSEAASFIAKSNQAKKDGKEKKPKRIDRRIIIGSGVGGVFLLLLAVVVARRSRRSPPMMQIAPQPMVQVAQQPVMQAHVVAPMPAQMPAHMPAPMAAPMPAPVMPYSSQPQMYGLSPSGNALPAVGADAMRPLAKTIAVGQGGGSPGGIAPTAFGSLSIGALNCIRGSLMGQRFALTATGLIVGRQPGVAHVVVNDQRASGKHVWIGVEQGRLVAIDQGTTNGTYINDVARGRITRAELRDSDVVIVSEPDCCSLQIKLG